MKVLSTLTQPNLVSPVAGLLGCMVIIAGLNISATHYLLNEDYSPLNHFISELGLEKASSMSTIFNKFLILGGVLLTIFVLGFRSFITKGKLADAGSFFGFFATLSFSGIGFFPADNWLPHKIFASLFFCGAMLSIFFFSLVIWHNKESKFNPLLSVLGYVIVASYFVALSWPKDLFYEMLSDPAHFVRPSIWILPLLEWIYCSLIGLWIIIACINMIYIKKTYAK